MVNRLLEHADDLIIVAGIVLALVGIGLVSLPAALIAAGIVLVVVGLGLVM